MGRVETGLVYEQAVSILDESNTPLPLRRIELRLDRDRRRQRRRAMLPDAWHDGMFLLPVSSRLDVSNSHLKRGGSKAGALTHRSWPRCSAYAASPTRRIATTAMPKL